MRKTLAVRPLLLLVFLSLALLTATPVVAQRITPEPARIDIIPMEVAHLPGDANADPLQVDAFSRNNMAVADGYAYIASGESGVRVVDVRDPYDPKHVAWVKPESTYEALTAAVAGGHLYVGQQSSFTIFDISNPAAPVETGSGGMTGYSGFVSANKDLVVVGMGLKLYVYRAGESDPSKYVAAYDFDPSSVVTAPLADGSSYTVADAAQNAAIDQARNVAVVTYDNGKAAVIDLTAPEAPRTLSHYAGPLGDSGIHAPGLYAVDGRIFVDYFTWLKVYDVAADGSLQPVGQHGAEQYSSGYHTTVEPRGMEVADGLAYIADYRNGLYVVDVRNPQKMYVRGYAYPGDLWWAADVEVDGDIVYLSSPQGGLRVYQLNGLGAPPAHTPPPPTATPKPVCTLTACTPTSVLYSWEFDASASPVEGCFVRVNAPPENLLGGSARLASLFDPLRQNALIGAFLDTFRVVMAEKWAIELIKVREGKQELHQAVWHMVVDIALEGGGKYVGGVLEFRGMKVAESEAAQHAVIGPIMNLLEDWLNERGVDLLRWYEAWRKWPYADMMHRVQRGVQLEEFSSYDDLLKKYPEAYNYLYVTEVWQCPETKSAPQPVPASGSLAGQIVFLSSRDYSDYPPDMPFGLRPHDVYSMNADGSGQNRITSDLRLTNMSAPAVSPDGTQIAIGARGTGAPVRLISPEGAVEKTLVVDRKDVRVGNWSANGLLMTAFGGEADPNQIIMHVQSNGYLDLTQDTERNGYGAISPDGKTVAFQNGPDAWVEHLQLWMMDVDGANKRLLLDRNTFDIAWSPDGQQIAFESYTDPTTSASAFDIWIVKADGTDARNLTQGRFRRHYSPTWSPDGSKIAFAASPDGRDRQLQIFVMEVATGKTTQITNQGNNFEPYWAPAAQSTDLTDKLLFFSDRDFSDAADKHHMGPQALYQMGADGDNQMRLSSEMPYLTGEQAALSPDGTQYAVGGSAGMITFYSLAGEKLRTMAAPTKSVWVQGFAPDRSLLVAGQEEAGSSGMRRALYLLDPASSAARQLTDDAINSWFGTLSPDGKTLAYQSDPDNWAKTAQVWAMDITGENKRLLADRNGYMMAWSPDGSQLAFESQTNPDDGSDIQYDIFLVNADGSNLRNLTQGRSERNYGPSWSPDGKQIAFAANQGRGGAPTQVYVVDVATGETKQLTTAGSNQIPWWVKTTTAPSITPTPAPRVAVGPELFDQKQASIERLSKLPIKFLYDLATYPSGFGYDEQRAQDALDLVRKEYEAGALSPERASAFYRLALEEEAQEKLYELAMQSTTDMADGTLSIATLAMGTADAIQRSTKGLIDGGGFYGDIWLKVNQFYAARLMEIAEYPIQRIIESDVPEYWDRDKIQAARKVAFDSISLRIREGDAPANILTDTAIRGPFAAALLKIYVAETQAQINDATAQVFSPDSAVIRGSDEFARIYAFGASGEMGMAYEAANRTELTHGLYEDFDLALDRMKVAGAIADIATLNPATPAWPKMVSVAVRVIGAASGGCGVWEGLTNTDFLIAWSQEMHRYIYNPNGPWSLDEHPIQTGGCSNLWIGALAQRSRGVGLSAPLRPQAALSVESDEMFMSLDALALAAQYGDAEVFARVVDDLMTVDEATLSAMKAHVASLPPAQREQIGQAQLLFEADMLAVYAYAMGLMAGSEDQALRDGLKAEVARAKRSLGVYRENVSSQVGSLPAVPAVPVASAKPEPASLIDPVAGVKMPAAPDRPTELMEKAPLIVAIVLGIASVLSAGALLARRRAKC
jgi:Tol biopolymer transport system component